MKNNYPITPPGSGTSRALAMPAKKITNSPQWLAKRALAVLAFLLVMAGNVLAQTAYVPVPPTGPGTSANNRGPSGAVTYQRVASIYSAAEMTGVSTSFPLTSLGFNINTPANLAATGNIKIYLVNTTDASFLRSTVWSTLISTPTAMQLVYDGPVTIPATAGWYDIPFTTNFNYTGGGIYMAFEWTRTSAATTAPVYNCNSTLVGGQNGWRGLTNNTAMPTDLTGTSAFRPWVRVGYTPPANDLAINAVYSLGKLPLTGATLPHVISASVTNMGSAAASGVITLNVTGANTFSTSATLPSLAFGQTTLITFPGFTPTNPGVNTITVTAPAGDAVAGNDVATTTQLVTGNTIAYAQGNPPVIESGAGITGTPSTTAGMGGFFTKYTVAGTPPVTIPVVRVGIANNTPSVGKRVFAVVLDANGAQIGRSAGYIIQAGDLGNLVSFNITTPPTVSNTSFYVGLAVTPGPAAYFPLGTQTESPVRSGAYYAVLSDTTFTGTTAPIEVTSLGRYVIEADLVPVILPAADLGATAITGLASGCALSATSPVCVTIQNFGTAAQTNFPVSYTINGGTAVTETVPGPIAPGATLNYCFTQTANLSAPGTYNFIAFTGLTGDAALANDSSNFSVTSSASVLATIATVANQCISNPAVILSATPAGGTFSGPGVTGTTFDPAVAGAGTHNIVYNVTQGICSGTDTLEVTVFAALSAPTANNGERCGPGSVEISANGAAGTVIWYASATGGTPIATGDTIMTPSITSTTTFYAASSPLAMSAAGSVGPLDGAAVGAGGLGGPFSNEMFFTAVQPFRLDSVTLISGSAGTYTIGIRNTLSTNPGSVVLDSVTVSVPGAGTHRVYLGLDIPAAGAGYTIGILSGTGTLFRNTDGAVYPYTLPGVVSITGANFNNDPATTRYYNFYNWSVSTINSNCESPRVPVTATINAAPNAAFTFTNTGNTFNFLATSATGTFAWTFTGGTPSSATVANPAVSFAGAGTYTATLVVTDGNCTSTTSQVIVISGRQDLLNAALSVFPNPTSGQVNIELTDNTGIEAVEVYNTLGQLVYQQRMAGQQQATLNLGNFAEGAYTVRVMGNQNQYIKQLLLQK